MSNKPKLWILGNGQLGAMLTHAATPLAIDVEAVDIVNPDNITLAMQENDIITAEREQWPESSTSLQLSQHNNFINGSVFSVLADRFTQKSLLDRLDIATAPWQLVTGESSEPQLYDNLGSNVLLKRRTGGYDGKGQHWLRQQQETFIPNDWRNEAIAEQAIPFDEEVSLVGARLKDGSCVFYPLTLNLHQDGILMVSISPLERLSELQSQAEIMLSRIMTELDYVGVMAMECFRLGELLLVNELAPRVHNSGHWTQAGCHINQFEMHVRALFNLPLPTPKVNFQCAMINLIGIDYNDKWLEHSNAELFWYGKEVRAGRKVGHLNLSVGEHIDDAVQSLKHLLPEQYQQPLEWLSHQLTAS